MATDETLEQASLLSLWETLAAERQYGNTVTLTGLCAGCYDANERTRLTLFATATCTTEDATPCGYVPWTSSGGNGDVGRRQLIESIGLDWSAIT